MHIGIYLSQRRVVAIVRPHLLVDLEIAAVSETYNVTSQTLATAIMKRKVFCIKHVPSQQHHIFISSLLKPCLQVSMNRLGHLTVSQA